jgi:anthranilate phosphoribosyltransferase
MCAGGKTEAGQAADMIVLNAGAALYATGPGDV